MAVSAMYCNLSRSRRRVSHSGLKLRGPCTTSLEIQQFHNIRGPRMHSHTVFKRNRTILCVVIDDSTNFSCPPPETFYRLILILRIDYTKFRQKTHHQLRSINALFRFCFIVSKPERVKATAVEKSRPNFPLLIPRPPPP